MVLLLVLGTSLANSFLIPQDPMSLSEAQWTAMANTLKTLTRTLEYQWQEASGKELTVEERGEVTEAGAPGAPAEAPAGDGAGEGGAAVPTTPAATAPSPTTVSLMEIARGGVGGKELRVEMIDAGAVGRAPPPDPAAGDGGAAAPATVPAATAALEIARGGVGGKELRVEEKVKDAGAPGRRAPPPDPAAGEEETSAAAPATVRAATAAIARGGGGIPPPRTGFGEAADPKVNLLPGPPNPVEQMEHIGRLVSILKAGVKPMETFL